MITTDHRYVQYRGLNLAPVFSNQSSIGLLQFTFLFDEWTSTPDLTVEVANVEMHIPLEQFISPPGVRTPVIINNRTVWYEYTVSLLLDYHDLSLV